MKKDRMFAQGRTKIEPFKFTEDVAQVFDDMLHRSVPLYAESIYRQSQLAVQYYQAGSRIYDLGCSNGNLGIKVMAQFGEKRFLMTGVDNSWPMIRKYSARLKNFSGPGRVNLLCAPMEKVKIKNASVVLINLTLQFLEKEKRDMFIRDIYTGLNPGGIFILTEKTIHEDKALDDLRNRFYKKYKLENGYSELEISQKRDALEKVLIPETVETHQKRIGNAGFSCCDVWLKWFNFTSMIAIK